MSAFNLNTTLLSVLFLGIASGSYFLYSSVAVSKSNDFIKEDIKLKSFLEHYQKAADEPWDIIGTTPQLNLGSEHENVIKIRKHLIFTGDLPHSAEINNPLFDEQVQQAVSLFQKRHGITANGLINEQTIKALNISPKQRLKQLQANIQRWSDFEKKQNDYYLWINIPTYQAQLIKQNKVTFKEKVVVGKPSRQTPELFSEITDIMLNPYWVVPPSLVKSSILPKVDRDANYLKEKNIRLFSVGNEEELATQNINSSLLAENLDKYFFRQEPGPLNPLGQIKYKITNSNSIYLHDTNSKTLFKKKSRALSSGCIRLQNPFKLFSEIVAKEPNKKVDVEKILSTGEPFNIRLENPIPVFITYLTAWVDAEGRLQFRDDIYKQDLA